MKDTLGMGMLEKRYRFLPRNQRVISGAIGAAAGLVGFLPVFYIILLVWELLFFIPWYGNYQFTRLLLIWWLLGAAAGAYLGISLEEEAESRQLGVWGCRLAAVLGGVLGAAVLAWVTTGLGVLFEIVIQRL